MNAVQRTARLMRVRRWVIEWLNQENIVVSEFARNSLILGLMVMYDGWIAEEASEAL